MDKYILGLNIGAKRISAMLFDHDSKVITSSYHEYLQHFLDNGWVECDAEEMYKLTLSAIDEALQKANVKPEQIAAIGISSQRETTVIGNKKLGWLMEKFFGVSVPIAGILSEEQAKMLGQNCWRAGTGKYTYDMESCIMMNTGLQYIEPSDGIFSPILYTKQNEINYGLEGRSNTYGAIMKWLKENIGIAQSIEELEQLAVEVDSSLGVCFIPKFVGPSMPYDSFYARGSMMGMAQGADKRHIARAALESIAYEVRDAVLMLEKKSGIKLKKLCVDGSGAESEFLLQFQADILGIPVEKFKSEEIACLGVAYMAGLAVGYWDSIEEIMKWNHVEKRFTPLISEEKRRAYIGERERAIQNLKSRLG